MIYVDRMIGRLGQLMQDPHPSSGDGGSAEDGESELIPCNRLRAGEGEKKPPWSQLLYGGKVEFLISLQRVVDGAAMFGKCRRVEHDEVIFTFLHPLEKLKSIVDHGVVSWFFTEVQHNIRPVSDTALGELSTESTNTAPPRRAYTEKPPGIAKHVQHVPAFGILLEQRAVVPLIDKKARLLPLEPVDMKLQSVFQCNILHLFSSQKGIRSMRPAL